MSGRDVPRSPDLLPAGDGGMAGLEVSDMDHGDIPLEGLIIPRHGSSWINLANPDRAVDIPA